VGQRLVDLQRQRIEGDSFVNFEVRVTRQCEIYPTSLSLHNRTIRYLRHP
jgi:hypothetical protein